MVLKNDISWFSHSGYKIEKTHTQIYQSHGYFFGKPTEITLEIMTCIKCKKDCKTANTVDEGSKKGKALFGRCEKCGMEYFV